jgi:hypothetical protein
MIRQQQGTISALFINIRDVKIDIYGRPVTANFKSHFEINCKLFEVKTICALKLKNELTTKNLSKPSETCRTYLQMQIEIPRLRLPIWRKRQS